MLENAFFKVRRMNGTLFRLVDRETSAAPHFEAALQQCRAQLRQDRIQVCFDPLDLRLHTLAARRAMKSFKQIAVFDDLRPQMSHPLHASASLPAAASAATIASPYFATRASPTPLIVPSAAKVSALVCTIAASCSLVNTEYAGTASLAANSLRTSRNLAYCLNSASGSTSR